MFKRKKKPTYELGVRNRNGNDFFWYLQWAGMVATLIGWLGVNKTQRFVSQSELEEIVEMANAETNDTE